MAVVICSEESNYFSTATLRHARSQPQFVSRSSYSNPAPPSKSSKGFGMVVYPDDDSAPSSPEFSSEIKHTNAADLGASQNLTRTTSHTSPDEDEINFPSYDDVGYYGRVEDLEAPVSPHTGNSYTVSPTSNSTSTNVSRPESPEIAALPQDDLAVRTQPSRHVDYLSHNWEEEDIWSSWKLIVSKRKAYTNSARLENASWRTWAKSKYALRTVSPETLNWQKDCDVTWLYGPLQCGTESALETHSPSHESSRLSKSNSFLNKKPILKKRSMSEIMLQRSLSSSSLLKQAAASVQAQQSEKRPGLGRAASEYVFFSPRPMSRDNTTMMSSLSSSGIGTPGNCEKKHIHFNEKVEQCIALEVKGDDEEEPTYAVHDYSDSDSDDGMIMMKRSNSNHEYPPLHRKRTTPRASFSCESKTIAPLPSTTLKYREYTPEPHETAMKHSSGFWGGCKLSPSPSQETLRPSKPSTRILIPDDDEDEMNLDWQPSSSHNGHPVQSSLEFSNESSGLRRTASGMLMPYEEDEDDIVSEGLFGKVIDTVNTAKDIAHVIWNVGWRR